MQSIRKPVEKKLKDKSKDEKSKLPDDKIKKGGYNVATPRDFVQRSSAADIYAQKKKSTVQSTPRKVPGTSRESKVTPMKDALKSSASSISQISNSSRISSSSKLSSVKARTAKDLPFANVTVNSPIAKRRLDLDVKTPKVKDGKTKTDNTREITNKTISVNRKEKEVLLDRGDVDRQRSKTRTLNENEVKQLTPDKVDNNEEMINLKQKLVAKPKAFYVDLDGDTLKTQAAKQSDEEVSYEDDFESYESDFDSYHSEKSNANSSDDAEHAIEKDDEVNGQNEEGSEVDAKEPRDEENMLDSGSFDLRDQRSAKSKPAAMEFILEGSEDDKVSSLDEGFQEGSSAVSSMKTVHVDVLDRPMFVDFNKSNEKRRKKIINEKMIQRAKDILSMVTLHEMSFTLFEMKPISYDLYMATFGRSNHTQIAVQTFDDGITEEVQTEEVSMDCKWTQHPVKFSKFDVYLNDETDIIRKKNRRNSEDYLSKFTFIFDNKANSEEHDLETLKGYKENPLRVLLEQKNGVGDCEMLPHEIYKNKLNPDFNMGRLGKFLKKVERNVNIVLSSNANGRVLENVMKSVYPFSSGYIGITTKNVSDEKSFLKQSKIVGVIFSESKHNLVLTVHRKSTSGVLAGKCLICLWDASVARTEPIKMLIAIDNLVIGRFRGSTDGIFIASLEDGSMHLWDLSEVPSWRNVVSSNDNDLVEVKTESLTQIEKDREWNLKNIDAGYDQLPLPFALQACAYTSSAANLDSVELTDKTVGLEFVGDARQDRGRRVVGQICSLQRLGALTIWTIVQEKTKIHDLGKAFWSKLKLERTQTISLTDQISAKEFLNDTNSIFNLNAGKKRMLSRKQEKVLARNFSRQKSTDSSRDRSSSVASARKLPVEKIIPHSWESGMVCSDLKIMQYNGADRYLVAKNYGEVLSCTRSLGALKVERLCVSSDTSPITCLEVSPGAACFLAATDSGTVHLYSVEERRVLLTLDCRNGTPTPAPIGPRADFKGSFVDTPKKTQYVTDTNMAKMTVTSVLWSRVNPCCIFTLSHEGALAAWDLTHSDIYPKYIGGKATFACMAADGSLALVTPDGDVQVHRLSHERNPAEYEQLFHKYVALL